jgi:hypothetical protein
MRNMSCSLTKEQVLARTKLVTRRLGWLDLRPGELIQLCEKCMGRKKGEPLVKLAVVRIVSVRRERLDRMERRPRYGAVECRLEGFPEKTPAEFVLFFCETHAKCTPKKTITRILWTYVDAPRGHTLHQLQLAALDA